MTSEVAITMLARALPDSAKQRLKLVAIRRRHTIEGFHRLFYNDGARTWSNTRWLGVPLQKCPLDLWVYQELVWELRPQLIVETGTACGGSALYLASLCDLVGEGRIVTIDVQQPEDPPRHDRLRYLTGPSTAPEIVSQVAEMARGLDPVLVVLDSDHRKAHVLEELRHYAPLVTPNSYLVVEDTNVNGNPVLPNFGPGPAEAVEDFLAERSDFVVDEAREKYYLTFNPRGFLRRAA